MANSGVPQFPQPGQYRPDSSQQSQRGNNNERSVGKLDRAPDEIRREITAQRKEIRAQGIVSHTDKQGNIRVSTPRGDIDVRLSADERHAPRPQVGQRVEVVITPDARDSSQPAKVTILPTAQATKEQAPPSRSSATPVQVEVRAAQNIETPRTEIPRPDPNASPPPNRFPESGSLVRLDPINAQQLQQLADRGQLTVFDSVRTSAAVPQVTEPITTQIAGSITTPPPITQFQPSAQLIEALPLQVPTQTNATVSVLQNAPDLPPLVQNLTQESVLSVPILNRAQAAIAQLQNAADKVLHQSAPPVALAQDARVGTLESAQIRLIAPGEAAPVEITPQNVITSTQNAAQISGVVIAKTQEQIPIVQFSVTQNGAQAVTQAQLASPLNAPLSPVAQQTYMLQFPSDALLVGSRIDVTPQSTLSASASAVQPNAALQALNTIPFANAVFPQPWPAMQDIQLTLQQSTAQNAAQTAQAFTATLPSPANASQFAPAALFFMAAVRGGDLGSWLSDKASEIIRNTGKSGLLSRISSEAAGLSRTADAPSGEWRGMNIPLFWEGDIQKIALHYRHDHGQSQDASQESGNKGTRFIFDLNLDVMGKVQLDGFFRPVSEKGPRLDIVLRTEERFSSAMQAEMRRVYMDAIKPSQVGGELSFQDGIQTWVMIDAADARELGVNA